jgi:hypothetical protein
MILKISSGPVGWVVSRFVFAPRRAEAGAAAEMLPADVHPAGVTDRAIDDCNLSVSIACAHALN